MYVGVDSRFHIYILNYINQLCKLAALFGFSEFHHAVFF